MNAQKRGGPAFPSNEIESLEEIALQVVAKNFPLYPHLAGLEEHPHIQNKIVERTQTDLPVTVTARNINQESYWQQKCKEDPRMKNVKKE